MADKRKTINDMLEAMIAPNETESQYSPTEIWKMIANQDSLEDMGFSSEEEKTQWIQNNPYDNF